ncbi:MAG: NADH-quinone oxidoreductase subunit N [Candidatus Thermoplasmatota archaeon]|nr:NADH-quinone oxidoreductase subunit N [Candidatus Thermoplasmatota archaeon]MEE3134903.1 NADH-quinone oxidoreductase subunit N [Candidatus Thermoplasmatota archaeon]
MAAYDVLSIDGGLKLLPEIVLLTGILALFFITNIGDAKIRIPLTRLRIPALLGGNRFKWNSDPRIPGIVSVFTLIFAIGMLIQTLGDDCADIMKGFCSETTILTTTGKNPVHLLKLDSFSRLFELMFFLALLLVSAASLNRLQADSNPSNDDLEQLLDNRRQVDFYLLLLISGLGMTIVAMSMNLFVLFIGLELASLPIYVLVAFHKESKAGSEAGVKYFITGAISSAVGLYGMSLLYLWSGSLQLTGLEAAWASMDTPEALPLFGISLLLVGFGFKISSVPFHFVAPDAYSGASSPIAALLATASKTLGFIGLMRILMIVTLPETGETAVWMFAFGTLSVVTMTWGNLAALGSENPKRMLAYSSVAHAGYMMAALVAVAAWKSGSYNETNNNGLMAAELIIGAIIFHLFVLISFKIGAFMVISHLETEDDVTDMSSLHGLAKREPIIATSMFVFMLALAGVPPLAGFMSKFLMVTGIVQVASADVLVNNNVDLIPTILGMHWTFFLAIAIFINSAISLYYYLRIGVLMFFEESSTRLPLPKVSILRFVIFVCAIGTVFFGVNSDWLVETVTNAASALFADS